jgi:hypothetical protein
MLFRMMFLYLQHLAVYWYAGFTANMRRGFAQICTDNLLTHRHFHNLMKFLRFLGLECSFRMWNDEIMEYWEAVF